MRPLILATALILSLVITYAGWMYKRHVYFYGQITKEFCIQQRFRLPIYDVVSCDKNIIVIENVYDWMVYNDYLYGSINKSEKLTGYVVNAKNISNVQTFNDWTSFRENIESRGLPSYTIEKTEGIAQLKYSEFDRKFPLTDSEK